MLDSTLRMHDERLAQLRGKLLNEVFRNILHMRDFHTLIEDHAIEFKS